MSTPSLSKPKAPKAKKPTRADFDRYLSLRAERLELDRRSAAIAREEKAIGEQIQAYVNEAGGKSRTVECCGHRASITSAPGSVSWVKEFTRVAGAAEAERLRREAPPVDRLKVEKL